MVADPPTLVRVIVGPAIVDKIVVGGIIGPNGEHDASLTMVDKIVVGTW